MAPYNLEISKLRKKLLTVQKLINCIRTHGAVCQLWLGLVLRPHSLAAVPQLHVGWMSHYSPAAVNQPPLSLCCSRLQILRCLTAPNELCTSTLTTVTGLSLTLAFTQGSWPLPSAVPFPTPLFYTYPSPCLRGELSCVINEAVPSTC